MEVTSKADNSQWERVWLSQLHTAPLSSVEPCLLVLHGMLYPIVKARSVDSSPTSGRRASGTHS